MKRKPIISMLLFFVAAVSSYSQDTFSYSKILYEYDSFIYDELYLASMESGSVWLSYKKPVSLAELKLGFEEINQTVISEEGLRIYENLYKSVYDNNALFLRGIFAFDINLKLALQAQYLHNGEKEPQINKFTRYNKAPELIALPFEFYFSKYCYGYCVPVLEKNFSGFNLSYPYTNLPLAQNAIDYHFPKKAGFSIGNSFFNLLMGRGGLNAGKPLSGGMRIGNTADRLDFVNAALFCKYVKLDMTIAELEPTRFFITHEISIRPVKQISITLHEGIMLDSVFDPKFLNPFMAFHNYAPWNQPYIKHENDEDSIGCQLGFDINIVPVKNLRIYGQFGMNQLQTPSELKGGANNIPNSMGGLAGIEYTVPLKPAHLTFTAEFMYADPWLYIGHAGKSNSFYTTRKEIVYASKTYEDSEIKNWVTNPNGPDTIAVFFKADFNAPRKYRASFSYTFLCKGENEEIFFKKADKKYYPSNFPKEEGVKMAKWKTPTGNPAYFHTLELEAYYNIIKNLDLTGSISWTIAHGKVKGHAVYFSTGISYSVR